ncbi:MAG: hypothetical protein HZB38_13600 [Planctomycetes bacterium]|nr:hypothetical protein [Planctomycetota bacterium]
MILRNLGVDGNQWLGFDSTPVATIDLCPDCVFPFVPHPAEVAVADLDGDGDDDIAVSSGLGIYLDPELGYRPRGMDGVFALKSNADGTFDNSTLRFGAATRPVRGLAVANLGQSTQEPDFLMSADGYWWKWYNSPYFYAADEQRYDIVFVSYNLGGTIPGMGTPIDLLRSTYDTDPPEPPNDVVIGQFHRPGGSSGLLLDFTAPNPWKALADPGSWDFSLGTNYNPPQPDFVVSTKTEPYPCTGGNWEFFDMVAGRFRMGSVMDDVAGRIGCWIEVFHYTPAGYPAHDCANADTRPTTAPTVRTVTSSVTAACVWRESRRSASGISTAA